MFHRLAYKELVQWLRTYTFSKLENAYFPFFEIYEGILDYFKLLTNKHVC